MLDVVEITPENWREALGVEVRPEQVRFVADYAPAALVILAKCYLRPDGRRWVPYLALAEGHPVGVFALAYEGAEAHLRHFAVDHRVQRQAFGRAMLAAALDRARRDEQGCRKVLLTAHPDNEAALALYREGGFVDTGIRVGIEPMLSRAIDDLT